MIKLISRMGVILFFILGLFSLSFSQEESITITTYYPSPYGSYNELRAKKMGIGETYYQGTVSITDPLDLIVEGRVGIGTTDNPTSFRAKLQVVRPDTGDYYADWSAIDGNAQGLYRAIGVRGYANDGDFLTWGVLGDVGSNGSNRIGVVGSGPTGVKGVGTGTGGTGVWAETTTGDAGVRAYGPNWGVRAELSSGGTSSEKAAIYANANNNGDSARFTGGDVRIEGGGTLKCDTIDKLSFGGGPTTMLDFRSGIWAQGNIYSEGWIVSHLPDLAEYFSTEPAEPGDVMVIDKNTNKKLVRSTQPYDYRVAGIISANPGFILGKEEKGKKLVALLGQVKCKATIENGSIVPGDLLVTSSKSGYVMRGDMEKLKPGMIVGKALEPLKEGEAKILVLVNGR